MPIFNHVQDGNEGSPGIRILATQDFAGCKLSVLEAVVVQRVDVAIWVGRFAVVSQNIQ